MKLSVRIPLLIGLIVLVTSASIILTIEVIVSKELENSAFNEISINAESNAELLESMLDGLLLQLYEIANRARTRVMEWEYVRPTLVPDVVRIGSLEQGLVFPDGTTHYVTTDTTTNLGDRDYIRAAFAGKSNVSDVLISRATNEPVVMFAAP